MKTTTQRFTATQRILGTLVFVASCSPVAAWALPPAGLAQAWLGIAATGDDGPTDAQQADELLRQARKAMADGNLELADSCISRAERLNPKYSIFHTGDTPKKARADLSRRLGLRSDGSSHSGVPEAKAAADTGPKDPFLAHRDNGANTGANTPPAASFPNTPTADSPAGEPPMRLPPVSDSAPAPATPWNSQAAAGGYPSTNFPPLNVGPRTGAWQTPPAAATNANPRAQSDGLLSGARKALAVGDARRAAALVEQAKSLGVHYELTDDSPTKVETLVRRYNDLMSQNVPHESDAFRHQYAGLLMEQAQWLLRWKEFDDAERLASDAKRMPIQYNPIELRPDTLLQQIAAERHGGGGAPGAAPVSPLQLLRKSTAPSRISPATRPTSLVPTN